MTNKIKFFCYLLTKLKKNYYLMTKKAENENKIWNS